MTTTTCDFCKKKVRNYVCGGIHCKFSDILLEITIEKGVTGFNAEICFACLEKLVIKTIKKWGG